MRVKVLPRNAYGWAMDGRWMAICTQNQSMDGKRPPERSVVLVS